MEKKILIVDDAMFMRKSIRKILSEGGYANVEEARDGDEAIAMFGEYNPDLVLLDITMPGKSGLEVLEEILRQDEDAAVVMCSAMGQETVIDPLVRCQPPSGLIPLYIFHRQWLTKSLNRFYLI